MTKEQAQELIIRFLVGFTIGYFVAKAFLSAGF